MYEHQVMPFHQRLCEALSNGGPGSVHLCGDATRHFRTIHDVLNVRSFDTGFPIDFEGVRRGLGPDVEILGGPTVMFLAEASPTGVAEEVRRILSIGIAKGGRFILREANNLPPGIPLENLDAMYDAVRCFGTIAPDGA